MNAIALARRGTIRAARPRRATTREVDIQLAIVGYLAAVAPAVAVWAVPNAALRERGGKASNGVPGLRKGVYDLSLIFPDGRFAAIEVKTEAGVLSPEQEAFGAELAARGVPHCVARSVEDVRAFLVEHGVETREAA